MGNSSGKTRGLLMFAQSAMVKITSTSSTSSISSTAVNVTAAMTGGQTNTKFMIVGLGNHLMSGTRHSVGMTLVNRICNQTGVKWIKDRHCQCDVAVTTLHENIELYLLKPRLMMNINGICVAKAVDKFGVSAENLYLVHDDLDKELGKFNIKNAGSAGGHKGVKSVIHNINTNRMPRLRFGVGRPARGDIISFVLGHFSQEEKELLPSIMDGAIEVLYSHIKKRAAGT